MPARTSLRNCSVFGNFGINPTNFETLLPMHHKASLASAELAWDPDPASNICLTAAGNFCRAAERAENLKQKSWPIFTIAYLMFANQLAD